MIFGEEDGNHMGGQPHGQPQRQLKLDLGQMETVYANFFALAGSPDEVVLYLGANSPIPNAQQPPIKVSHRIMFLPANAKRLMMALQQTIKAHEDRFGPIEIPPNQRPQGPNPGSPPA